MHEYQFGFSRSHVIVNGRDSPIIALTGLKHWSKLRLLVIQTPITNTFGFDVVGEEEELPFVVFFIAINSTSELVVENLLRLILVGCIIICGDCLSISTSHISCRGRLM